MLGVAFVLLLLVVGEVVLGMEVRVLLEANCFFGRVSKGFFSSKGGRGVTVPVGRL